MEDGYGSPAAVRLSTVADQILEKIELYVLPSKCLCWRIAMDASEDIGSTLLPSPIKMYFVWIVFSLLVGMSCAIAFYTPEPRPYLGLCLPIATGLLLIPYAFRFAHRRFVEWTANVASFAQAASSGPTAPGQAADRWILSELSFFNGSPPMYGAGLCLAAWTLSAFYLGGYLSNLGVLQLSFFCILTTLSASLAGAGLYAIFCGARLIWRLGDGRYRVDGMVFHMPGRWELAIDVRAGQAVIAHKGEWVRYSTPDVEGAEYIAVCLPAFSMETVHRDAP